MRGPHTTRDFDWTLLGLVMAIATLGVVEIYSATRNTAWEGAHLKQLLWIGLGLVLFWAISRVDYKTLVDQAPHLLRHHDHSTSDGCGFRLHRRRGQAMAAAARRPAFAGL